MLNSQAKNINKVNLYWKKRIFRNNHGLICELKGIEINNCYDILELYFLKTI